MKKVSLILSHFGKENQKVKAVEELNELIQAIQNGDKQSIMEEIADVSIMIEQIIKMYDICEISLVLTRIKKINRTLQRIEEGYYENRK